MVCELEVSSIDNRGILDIAELSKLKQARYPLQSHIILSHVRSIDTLSWR